MATERPEVPDPIDTDAVASITDEVRDDELAFGGEGEDSIAVESWLPADRPAGIFRHGTTAAEEAEGARLTDRLAAELPDLEPGDDDYRPDELGDADRAEIQRVIRGDEGGARVS